jgi:hypothetical protein
MGEIKMKKKTRTISVRAKTSFLAVSKFFGKSEFGETIKPVAVKKTKVKGKRIKKLYDVKLAFKK